MTLPLHRSGLALLTHPALPLGRDAHPLKRVRMMDCRFGKMALGDSLHAMPRNVTVLTSPAQGFPPASRHLEMEVEERLLVPRHSKVTVVTRKDRAQVFPLFSNRLRAAAPQLLLDLSNLRVLAFPHRASLYREHPVPVLHSTDVGESEEIERRGFGFASMNCASSCIGTEFDDTRLFGVKNEAVLPEPFPNRRVARNRVVLVLKSDDEVSSPGESHPQALSEPD